MQNIAAGHGLWDVLRDNNADVATDALMNKGAAPLAHRAAVAMPMSHVLSRLHNDMPTQNYKGAVRDIIDEFVHQWAGTGMQDDAMRFVQSLDRGGAYDGHTTTGTLTLAEAERQLHAVAGSPSVTAHGSMARGVGDAITVIDTRPVTPGVRWASALLARLDVGTPVVVPFFSCLNLRSAASGIDRFDSAEDFARIANFTSVLMGGRINGLTVATRAVFPAAYGCVGFQSSALRGLSSATAVRWFG